MSNETWVRCGLDLGSSNDYTALVVVVREGVGRGARYRVGEVRRWRGVSYPSLIAQVGRVMSRVAELKWPVHLYVDGTGLGKPVTDMLRQAYAEGTLPVVPRPIVITGADAEGETPDGARTVPKADLVANLEVILATGRLKVAGRLPLARALRDELASFTAKVSSTGRARFEASRGHDDLVTGLLLAVWGRHRVGLPAGREDVLVPRAGRMVEFTHHRRGRSQHAVSVVPFPSPAVGSGRRGRSVDPETGLVPQPIVQTDRRTGEIIAIDPITGARLDPSTLQPAKPRALDALVRGHQVELALRGGAFMTGIVREVGAAVVELDCSGATCVIELGRIKSCRDVDAEAQAESSVLRAERRTLRPGRRRGAASTAGDLLGDGLEPRRRGLPGHIARTLVERGLLP